MNDKENLKRLMILAGTISGPIGVIAIVVLIVLERKFITHKQFIFLAVIAIAYISASIIGYRILRKENWFR